MKPDVIVCWPRNCDYPLWRQFIRDNRERFAKVIVAFTEHDGFDYSGFVREAMADDNVTFLDSYRSIDRDWRDQAVNDALNLSTAEWVWFTEQDFFITDPSRFWDEVEGLHFTNDAMGWMEPGGRWHPSCLFVRRSAIEETPRYFGPVPVDHFWTFGRQLLVWHLTPGRWEHMQGLSQNHYLVDNDIVPGRFREDVFAKYIATSLLVSVPLHPDWARKGEAYVRTSAA